MGWNMGSGSVDPASRVINKLSARSAQTVKKPGYHGDGGGLYLRVTRSGSKSWLFRYTFAERTRDMGLGPYPAVSLSDAREAAHSCRRKIAAGIDPIAAREADRLAARSAAAQQTSSFKACAEAYLAAHENSWSNPKHRAQWRSTLTRYVYPVFGSSPVKAIDTAMVLQVLEPIWSGKPETASRVRGRIETIMNWAKARGLRTGENPAQWRGHLDQLLPATSKVRRTEHHSALPYREVPGFVAMLSLREDVSARALEFLILTAARTSEVLGATWSEINLADGVWTIPAERMKARRVHRVPLTADMIAILTTMTEVRRDDYVFPGHKPGRPLSQMALLMLLRRMGFGHVTAHGFRSSFRDWAAECSSHSRETAEMALAHALSNRVEAAYMRSDLFNQRRKLMSDWSDFALKR
jgi:integrase